MTKCKQWRWICLVIAMTLPVGAQEPAKKPAELYVSGWMKLKLEHSQNILAGIAKADYDLIVKNAEGMQTLTTIEAFVRSKIPGYSAQVEQFKDATEELIKQAKKDNVEGATLAFTQLTLSCVNCHKRLREDAKRIPK
jgi:cytochrome c556